MVRTLLGLALLGGGAVYLLNRQGYQGAFGESGIPYKPDSAGAFDDSGGIPFLPDWFARKNSHELSDGTLELGWLDGWLNTDSDDGQGGSVMDWFDPDWSIFDMTEPRGIRNNNPGNIEYNGTQWQGLANPPSDGRFMRFTDPVYGIRAIARVLDTYANVHGINTVSGIVNRWAPAFENNTGSYAANVAQALGVGVDQPIDVMAKRPQLVQAIIAHENGQQPYPASLINDGVRMA